MIYVKWAIFAVMTLFINMLSVILSPAIAGLSVALGVKTLPAPLSWFYTHDADLDGGQIQQPTLYPSGVSGVKLWQQRVRWICRNPGYGFAANVVGIPVGTVFETGTLDTGIHHRFYDENGKCIGWGYRRDIPLGSKRFCKFWIGWRHPSNDGKSRMIKVMFNPFRTR